MVARALVSRWEKALGEGALFALVLAPYAKRPEGCPWPPSLMIGSSQYRTQPDRNYG